MVGALISPDLMLCEEKKAYGWPNKLVFLPRGMSTCLIKYVVLSSLKKKTAFFFFLNLKGRVL